MDGTTVVINRRELEFSVSGLMGEQYPAPYIKHLVDRLHHPGALRLLDLEVVESEEIIQACQSAGGHGGLDEHPRRDRLMELDPAATGNHAGPKRGKNAAIRKAVNSGLRAARPRPPRDGRGRSRRRSALRQRAGAVLPNDEFPGPLTSAFERPVAAP